MLYLIYGDDFKKRNAEAQKLLGSLMLKDAVRIDMDTNSWSEKKSEELIAARSMFGIPLVAVLSGVFEDEMAEEYILKKIKEMADASTHFVFLENVLTQAIVKKFSANAGKVIVCERRSTSKKIPFNAFALADALAERSRKKLWIALALARREHIPMEQLHGTLFWQTKMLFFAKLAEDGDASGLAAQKPFVQQKARQGAKHFSHEELHALSKKFIDAYHRERAGGASLDTTIEEIVLML